MSDSAGDPLCRLIDSLEQRLANGKEQNKKLRAALSEAQRERDRLIEGIRNLPWNAVDGFEPAGPIIVERGAWDALTALAQALSEGTGER